MPHWDLMESQMAQNRVLKTITDNINVIEVAERYHIQALLVFFYVFLEIFGRQGEEAS